MRMLGDDYECRAARWLRDQQGLPLVARNFRGKTGEIDIIARDGEPLTCFFVPTRNWRRCHADLT